MIDIKKDGSCYAARKNKSATTFSQSVLEIGQAALYLNVSVTELKLSVHSKEKLLRGIKAPMPATLSVRGKIYFDVAELDRCKADFDAVDKNDERIR